MKGWGITCQLCVQLSTHAASSSKTKQKDAVCCCLCLPINARPVPQKILLASLTQRGHRDPKHIRDQWPREEKVGNLVEQQDCTPKQTWVTRRVKEFNPNQACTKFAAGSFWLYFPPAIKIVWGWSTCPMRRHWRRWVCSTWWRDGCWGDRAWLHVCPRRQ